MTMHVLIFGIGMHEGVAPVRRITQRAGQQAPTPGSPWGRDHMRIAAPRTFRDAHASAVPLHLRVTTENATGLALERLLQ